MPYEIRKQKGPKPFKIVHGETGKVVGSSETMEKAMSSVTHRLLAEGKK